jgi:hypothetical protein
MSAVRDEHLIEQLERLAPGDPLRMIVAALRADNERLRARLAKQDVPPSPEWLTIKVAAYRAGITYEAMRMWIQRGWVDSRREGSLIFVNAASLDARLARLGRRS